jgi:hypothetical protein
MNTTQSRQHSSPVTVTRRASLAILAMTSAGLIACCSSPVLAAQKGSGRAPGAYAGFSFLPPAGWEVSTEYPDPKVRLLYLGPTQRGFRANVNLIVEQDGGESFEEISQQAKEAYTLMLSAKVSEEGRIQIDGKDTLYMSSDYRMGPLQIRNAQFFVRGGNGKVYILTYTATADVFESLGPAIAQSAKTIKIEKNKFPSLPKAPRVTRSGARTSGK